MIIILNNMQDSYQLLKDLMLQYSIVISKIIKLHIKKEELYIFHR